MKEVSERVVSLLPPLPDKVHLSVSGSIGGTTLALQYSREVLLSGGRVLWATPEMPDSVRFQQLFSDVDLIASSRFHALQFDDNLKHISMQIVNAKDTLPRVQLIVIDDWAPSEGQAPRENIDMVTEVLNHGSDSCSIVIISKSYESPDAGIEMKVRGGSRLVDTGVETWHLLRQQDGNERCLDTTKKQFHFNLESNGFI
ncbi:MAG TPA: hypothetical protein EYQ53_06120 [Candidatus Poseidoniales archaeon]|nr:MAG: hypothetical protein CXT69_02605 [Euryarchaeota archaeon]HIG03936.1 hypothetical protein [Candidatus Poseidoniales archaeon]HIK78611.1 hypothetical protein [Candidatus Poseidoniales archaeon]